MYVCGLIYKFLNLPCVCDAGFCLCHEWLSLCGSMLSLLLLLLFLRMQFLWTIYMCCWHFNMRVIQQQSFNALVWVCVGGTNWIWEWKHKIGWQKNAHFVVTNFLYPLFHRVKGVYAGMYIYIYIQILSGFSNNAIFYQLIATHQ